MEMPYCNADCFQLFLDELSTQNQDELKKKIEYNYIFTGQHQETM
mgnify:CR=1 FL=1